MASNIENVDDDKKNETKQLNVRISLYLHEKLDAVNEPKGTVVVRALEEYFEREEKNRYAEATGLSQEYVNALIKQLEAKDKQIEILADQLKTKDEQITERDNTTKMHIAQVQTLINQRDQLDKKQLEEAKKQKELEFEEAKKQQEELKEAKKQLEKLEETKKQKELELEEAKKQQEELKEVKKQLEKLEETKKQKELELEEAKKLLEKKKWYQFW